MKKLILLILLMSIGCIINAQINSIASGNWNNPGVWQGGQVPGATDDVVINGHSITLNVVAEVNNLTFNNATFSGGSNLTINGHFIWNGGTINGTGVIWSLGTALLTGAQKNMSQKTIRLVGESLWNSGNITNSSAFLVVWTDGELTVNVPSNQTLNFIQNGGGASFHNYGQLIKTGEGSFVHGFNTFFYNFSTGIFQILEGTWQCGWHTELYGTVQISQNASLSNVNSMWLRGTVITGAGYLIGAGGSLRSTADTAYIDNLHIQAGNIANEVDNTIEVINVMNNFLWTGGSLTGQQGQVHVFGHTYFTGGSKQMSSRRLFLNNTGLWDSGDIANGGGFIVVRQTGGLTIDVAESQTINLTQNGNGASLHNYGQLIKTGAGNFVHGFNTFFYNFSTGNMNIQQGNWTAGWHTELYNTIQIGANATLRNTNSMWLRGAVITGEGYLIAQGGSLKSTANTAYIDNLHLQSGNITNEVNNTIEVINVIENFLWTGGSLQGQLGQINVNGHAYFTGGNKEISSRRLNINNTALWDSGTISASFTNNLLFVNSNAEFEISVMANNTLNFSTINSFAPGAFNNIGTIRKTGLGNFSCNFGTTFGNFLGSSLQIEGGAVNIACNYAFFGGNVDIVENSTMNIQNTVEFNGTTIVGNGFVVLSASLNLGTTPSNVNNLRMISGNITYATQNSGITLNIEDNFIWEGGNLISGLNLSTVNVNGNAIFTSPSTKSVHNGMVLRIHENCLWDNGLVEVSTNSRLVVGANAEFEIYVPLNQNRTINGIQYYCCGNFENYGLVKKTGEGSLSHSFLLSFFNFGTIQGIGTIIGNTYYTQNGFLSPGFPIGTLTTQRASASFVSTGGLNIELLDDSGPGTGHDRAIFTGTVALNGSLIVTELASMPNGSYTILTCNGGANCRTGTFSFTDLPDCFSVQYTGNSVILVKDDQSPPEIVGCPDDVTINTDPGQCYAVYNITDPQASDDCLLASLEGNMPPLNQFPVGLTIVTFIATDGSGNSSTCTFEVTVEDTQSPIITGCPNNMIVQTTTSCTAIVSWTEPQATDNCELSSFEGDTTNGEEYGLGTFTVHYIASDLYNNTSTCTFTVSVVDQSNPIITNCPTNIAMNADEGTCTATVSWEEPSAMDNCGIQSFVGDGDNGGSYAAIITTVTYTAIDVNGNQSICTFTITIMDSEDPVINNCPEDIYVNTNVGTCVATVSWTAPTATDNCGEPTLESSHYNGGIYELGSTLVTYTATDGGGLMSTCSFTISVTDIESPNITDCPEDIEVNTNEGLCVAIVSWNEPNANDNCGVQTFVGDGDNGGNYGVGTSTVIYTATDASNNQTNCSFSIIVTDDQAPLILGCPDNIVMTTIAGQCFAIANWTEPSASDNCGEPELVGDGNNGGNYPVGSTLVTYLATDVNGLSSTCTFNITVLDNELPMITNCPQNIEVPTDFGQCTAIVSWIEPEATDNCGVETFINNHTNGGAYPIGVTQVNYTATDAQGNTAQCSFTISVLDEFIITCPEDVTVCINGNEILLTGAEPTGGVFSGNGVIDGTFYPSIAGVGLHVILYELQIGECISNCTFFIVVTPLPVVLCPDNFEVCIVDQSFELLSAYPQGGLYTGPGVVANVFDPAAAGIGTHEINYSFTDTNDCETSCDFSINVYAQTLWYADTDGDGFGDPEESLLACEQPEGYVSNNLDNCPLDFNKIDEGQCGCGIEDTDTDGDGTVDCNDECPLDPEKVNPGQCGCGMEDTDTDGDGTADCNDECPLDPDKVNPGICGCGISDIDTDGDGTADCNDECPLDPDKINPGQCGCGIADTDTDGDGVADCNDECPLDPDKINPGQCGCGIADTDTDGDGVADCNDECPLDPNLTIAPTWYADADGDGFGDASNFMVSCLQPEGYVSNNLDCNDSDAEINPNAIEVCNGYDDNCDGIIDEGCSVPGCLDPEAHNYNPEATDDDGSCETCSDQIKNGDETGVDCGGILCPVCPGDDFFVTYPTLSKEIVEPGETLLASVLHHYSGAEPSVFVYVGFYLSEDDQLDQTDILLNDELSTLGYYNGFDYESGNIEIPVNTVEGNYYILFVADYNQLYTEIDENNNLLALPITVETLPAGDDFFITEAAVSATTVSPGGTLLASCLQNYSGSSEATLNVTMGYYYSTDAIWDPSDVLLNTDESTLSASDTADEEDANLTIPLSAVAGTAYILFVADHTDAFEETNEDNNVSSVAITIDAPPVGNDFFITNAATNHAQRNPGQSLSMSCHQSYAGSSFSTLIVRMGYYLSTDDQFNAGDVRLGTDNSGLSATKTSEYEDLTRNIPFGTPHGYYYILFVADDNNIYDETNENNNTVAIPITIGNPPLLREVNHGQNSMSINYILTNDTEIINEDNAFAEIQVSPNPFSQFIHLNWTSFGDLESVNCVIRDHTGRMVSNFKNVTPGAYLETNNLISGMYVLEVFSASDILVNRYRVIKVE